MTENLIFAVLLILSSAWPRDSRGSGSSPTSSSLPSVSPSPSPLFSSPGDEAVREEEETFLDDAYHWLTSFGSGRVSQFDNWFGDDDTLTEEIQGPWFRVRLGGEWEEGGFVFKNRFRAVVPLPALENKLGVYLGSDSDDEFEDDQDYFDREDSDSERNPTAGLRYQFTQTRDFSFSTNLGIKFKWPPSPYIKSRLQYTHQAGRWMFRPIQYFYYYTDDGPGMRTKLEINRYLGSRFLARSYSQGTYSNESSGIDLSQEFSLQYLNFDIRHGNNYAAALEWESLFHTWPSFKADRHQLTFRYYRSVWRPWLRIGLGPRLTWKRFDEDDEDLPGEWDEVSPSLIMFVEILFEKLDYDEREDRYRQLIIDYDQNNDT